MKKQEKVKIGILNLMHNKKESQQQFAKVLTDGAEPVELTFYYPATHYNERPVPAELRRIAKPLDLEEVKHLDAFIISGAPIEKLAFEEVRYIAEVKALLDVLAENDIEQLYVCWGAMAALNYFYGIQKRILPAKVFGVYPNAIQSESNLLFGMPAGFPAPHARYAEMDHKQIAEHDDLALLSSDMKGHLTLVEAAAAKQTFLFSHLEYDKDALLKEYQREAAAYPEAKQKPARPEYYFKYPEKLEEPVFSWKKTQRRFYSNWLKQVSIAKNQNILAFEH
ncbi:homoserine O-succinyltransferase [Liquorilactobacillus sucicola DSM 21376 = JCM 15457]|nr:homoserine O-succinyltransferase [Liquorilactobacillus sucicola DSM 21376 = JCM 15457]